MTARNAPLSGPTQRLCDDDLATIAGGVRISFPDDDFVPFPVTPPIHHGLWPVEDDVPPATS